MTDGDRASRIREGRNRSREKAKKSEGSEGSESSNSSDSSESSSGSGSDESSSYTPGDVRNRQSKNMYLPEEQIKSIDNLFKEAEFRLHNESGISIKKNRDFYPAFVQVALENFDLGEFIEQKEQEE